MNLWKIQKVTIWRVWRAIKVVELRKEPIALDKICPCVAFQVRTVLCPDSTGSMSSGTEHPLFWSEKAEDETEAATMNPPASLVDAWITNSSGRLHTKWQRWLLSGWENSANISAIANYKERVWSMNLTRFTASLNKIHSSEDNRI